ncbi:MAG: hypothetical protein QOH26_1290 [Actinomycetota bacterium]|jgi:hypothetical protein|nr:hypothetical protein [Actinomycetota bacterium]
MAEDLVMMTTRLDRHGERFTKEALDQIVRQIDQRPGRWTIEHDATLLPYGKTVAARVVPTDDGEDELLATRKILRVVQGDGFALSSPVMPSARWRRQEIPDGSRGGAPQGLAETVPST